MSKLLRAMAILIGVLVVLVVAAALILPRVIDPNVYRERIAALVKEKTGRELIIAGDIGWSVFPWLGVELGAVRLANAPGFGDQPFARVEGMQVRVKLLPLLSRQVEMSTVVLDGLQLNLARDKTGRSNWDDLLEAASASRPAEPEPPTPEEAGAPIAALAIGGVQIRDASLSWDDRAADTHQTIEDLNVTLGAVGGDRPVDLQVAFELKSDKPARTAQVKLDGQVTAKQSFRQIEVDGLALSIDAQGEGLPGGRIEADLAARVAFDQNQHTLTIQDLVLKAYDLTLRGQAQGSGIGAGTPQFAGTLKLDDFVPRELFAKLDYDLPETSDSGVLRKAGMESAFTASAKAASLSGLKLHLDDTHITGTAGVRDFAAAAISFDLMVDNLDLDRYLPPRKPAAPAAAKPSGKPSGQASAQPSATPGEVAAGGAALLPVEMLRGLRLDGTVKIGSLKAYQIRSSDVSVTLAANQGLVRAYPASAKLYQGGYRGDVTVDVRGKQPRIALDEQLAGVAVGPLLTDMLGEAKVTGTATVAAKLSAAGNDPAVLRKTLNGTANFAFTDGVIKGMDVLGEIRKAYALVRGKSAANVSTETGFSALTGTATITKGLVNNPDLQGKSPLMQVQGKGTANLVTEALDYRITATLVDSLEGKDELTGRPIPVHITGSFSKPKVGVDLKQVLEQEVRKQVEKKVQEKLQDDLKGGLKGLFGK
ncbi:MAG TPA: AsmA family protein [Gammaproteobacteria bacterium]